MNKVRKDKAYLVATIIFATLAVLESIFRIDLGYWLTPFLAWIPMVVIWGGFWLLAIINVIRLISSQSDPRRIPIIPVFISIGVVVVTYLVPLDNLYAGIDHKLRNQSRLDFISSANSTGINIQTNEVNEILLPASQKHLSKNRESVKWVRKGSTDYVLFYWWHGMFGEESGFLYCSNDKLPEYTFLEYTLIRSHKKLDENWYFIWCSRQ
jgi:hypothetical protein